MKVVIFHMYLERCAYHGVQKEAARRRGEPIQPKPGNGVQAKTCWELFLAGLDISPNGRCVGQRVQCTADLSWSLLNKDHDQLHLPKEFNGGGGGGGSPKQHDHKSPDPEAPDENAVSIAKSLKATTMEHSRNSSQQPPGDSLINIGTYRWLTYADVKRLSLQLGTSLIRLRLCEPQEIAGEQCEYARRLRPLGVLSPTCAEWIVIHLAANAFGITIVPLHEKLGLEALSHIVQKTQIECIMVEHAELPTLAKLIKSTSSIQFIIIFHSGQCLNAVPPAVPYHCPKFESEVSVLTLHDLLNKGKDDMMEPIVYSPKTVQSLIFTSGTTGPPKGVIATHEAIVESCNSLAASFCCNDSPFRYAAKDLHLSYLPMGHIMGSLAVYLVLKEGASLGFVDNPRNLNREAQELQPTFLIAVPRVVNYILEGVRQWRDQQSPLFQWFYDVAIEIKLKRLRETGDPYHPLLDPLFFHHFRAQMGGHFRIVLTGSAVVRAETERLFKAIMCCPLIQIYGATETTGAVTITDPFCSDCGHVGFTLPRAVYRLEPVPELGYDPNGDPARGEVVVSGRCLSEGYFRETELTREVFKDGWYHTGDIAELTSHGALKIIDRKKSIFKLSHGEFVIPEKIEGVYSEVPLVSQAFVCGYFDKDYLVGIISTDIEAAEAWGRSNGLTDDVAVLCQELEFSLAVQEQMRQAADAAGLKGFERVRKIRLIPEPFASLNLVTPTLKLKRNKAKELFRHAIDEMYQEANT